MIAIRDSTSRMLCLAVAVVLLLATSPITGAAGDGHADKAGAETVLGEGDVMIAAGSTATRKLLQSAATGRSNAGSQRELLGEGSMMMNNDATKLLQSVTAHRAVADSTGHTLATPTWAEESTVADGNDSGGISRSLSRSLLQSNAIDKIVTNLVDGQPIAFRSGRTGAICCDEGTFICNRNAVGPWETFTIKLVPGVPGGFALKSGRTGKYCCDDPSGFICNRDAIGLWETFVWYSIINSPNKFAFTSKRTSQFCSDFDPLRCNLNFGTSYNSPIGTYEVFTIVQQLPLLRQSRGGLWKTDNLQPNDGNMYTAIQAYVKVANEGSADVSVRMGATPGSWRQESRPALTVLPGITGEPKVTMFRTDADVFVMIRGSTVLGDWANDATMKLVPYTYTTPSGQLQSHGLVHMGFLTQTNTIWPVVKDYLDAQIPAARSSSGLADVRVWVIGHSLGAACAILMAIRIQNCYTNTQSAGDIVGGVYAFAAPNVADPLLSTFFTAYENARLTPKTFKVSNAVDAVVSVPPQYADPGIFVALCPSSILASGVQKFAYAGPICPELAGMLPTFPLHNATFYSTSLLRLLPTTGHAETVRSWFRSNGLVTLDAGCTKDAHCMSGCGVTSVTANCGTDFRCFYGLLIHPWTCGPALGFGAACARTGECASNMKCGTVNGAEGLGFCYECLKDDHCPSDKFCELNPLNTNPGWGRCRAKLGWNSGCDRNRACAPGQCVSGRCGISCTNDGTCAPHNKFCERSNHLVGCGINCCRDKLGNGESCDNNRDASCASGVCAGWAGSSTCGKRRSGTCDRGVECNSNSCTAWLNTQCWV